MALAILFNLGRVLGRGSVLKDRSARPARPDPARPDPARFLVTGRPTVVYPSLAPLPWGQASAAAIYGRRSRQLFSIAGLGAAGAGVLSGSRARLRRGGWGAAIFFCRWGRSHFRALAFFGVERPFSLLSRPHFSDLGEWQSFFLDKMDD